LAGRAAGELTGAKRPEGAAGLTRLRLGCAREPYMERSRMDEGREEEAFDAAGDGGPSPNVHDKPLDAADGEDERTCAPSGGVPDMLAPDGDDDAPGMAVGEDKGRPMRFDFVYERPVDVVLDEERAVAPHPPFDGRVRVQPKRKNARAVVVAVDDLDDAGRRALRAAPTRRRIEVHVRCRVRHCAKVYRAWLCKDMTIQDTRGREIGPVEDLFAARCSNHGPTKKGESGQ